VSGSRCKARYSTTRNACSPSCRPPSAGRSCGPRTCCPACRPRGSSPGRPPKEGLARIEQRLAALNPPPVRKIPVLLGGGGERKTLALVARFADIWNTFAEGEDYERKSRVLDEYCRRFGRDPAAIERSVLAGGPPDKSGESLLAMGARLFVLSVNPSDDLAEVKRWVAWRDRRNA